MPKKQTGMHSDYWKWQVVCGCDLSETFERTSARVSKHWRRG